MSIQRIGLLVVVILAAVAASVAATMLADPLAQRAPKLLFVTHGATPWDESVVLGAQEAARAHGVTLEIRTASRGSAPVANAIARAVAEGIDGAAVASMRGDGVARDLHALGVTNIVACGDAACPEAICHVRVGRFSTGRLGARLAQEALPRGGRLVVLVDDAENGVGAERLEGFRNHIDMLNHPQPRYEIVECLEDHGSLQARTDNLRSAIESDAEIDCVIDLADRAEGSVSQLSAVVKSREISVITCDRSEASLAAVEAGEIYAVVGENPYQLGYQAVNYLAGVCRGGSMAIPAPTCGNVNVPASVIRRNNVAQYRSSLSGAALPAA